MTRLKNTMILRARRVQVILQLVARKYMLSLDDIRGDDRATRLVAARREVCVRAKAEGIGSTTIAKILHRDQDTVRYHFDPKNQETRRNRYLAKKAEIQANQ